MSTPPHLPEPLPALRARFDRALARVFQLPEMYSALPPQQYFDFEDGVRLCVTLELHDGGLKIHASLSAFRPEPIRAMPDPKQALQHYWQLVTDRPFVPDQNGILISDRGHAHVWMPAGVPA